jgi:hypothetical protein
MSARAAIPADMAHLQSSEYKEPVERGVASCHLETVTSNLILTLRP